MNLIEQNCKTIIELCHEKNTKQAEIHIKKLIEEIRRLKNAQ